MRRNNPLSYAFQMLLSIGAFFVFMFGLQYLPMLHISPLAAFVVFVLLCALLYTATSLLQEEHLHSFKAVLKYFVFVICGFIGQIVLTLLCFIPAVFGIAAMAGGLLTLVFSMVFPLWVIQHFGYKLGVPITSSNFYEYLRYIGLCGSICAVGIAGYFGSNKLLDLLVAWRDKQS